MRFLAVNNLRLGRAPGGIPAHIDLNRHGITPRDALARIVELATQHQVHAVLLTGETIAEGNSGLEPLGPLQDGLGELARAGIPVVVTPVGVFNSTTITALELTDNVHFIDERLDWHPPFVRGTAKVDGPSIHVIDAALSETHYAATSGQVVTMDAIDHPDSIWILTNPLQPDSLNGEHALVVEPGSPTPLHPTETNRHGVWVINTDNKTAELIPIAALEFASIDIDVSAAEKLSDIEPIVIEHLAATADSARSDGSVAATLLVDGTLTGRTRLFSGLHELARELEQSVSLEHQDVTIAVSRIVVDAVPDVDLEPLLNRPDPVGELARLITALENDDEPAPAQQSLMHAVQQRLLAVRHARVFGAVHDDDIATDPDHVLKQQAWALLDSLIRQRGID